MAPSGRPIHDLVAAVVASEPRACDALLAGLLPMVQRYCRVRLGYRETPLGSADDIAQDVCLAVVRALPGAERRDLPIQAFVYAIAANRIADAYRALARNRADPVAEAPDAAAGTGGPEARLLEKELSRKLDELLHLLTPHQREVLMLRIAVGLTAKETANATGSTPGGVRVTQHRALNQLRAHFRTDLSTSAASRSAGLRMGRAPSASDHIDMSAPARPHRGGTVFADPEPRRRRSSSPGAEGAAGHSLGA